jgi:serine/threonine protein kinase
MAFVPTAGVEPIPGYHLLVRLGNGGYGEVWKATAPGGLSKAIKVIYGNLTDVRADQELRALNRVREVRHPFLLSLERVEILENQVFIVTELADGSLMERFTACRSAGLPGIPRDEMLNYLRDAADALDFMSEQHGLQHLDIKPQNLLLVGGRVKIADFGLVKHLAGTSITATGGVTPLYASPEAFDNRVSRFSDQYSLAVVYQEMLTGSRPFPGQTTLQLAAQHLGGRPLLDALPAADRPVIARALAKVAEHRFPTCREMVERLRTPSALAGEGAPRVVGAKARQALVSEGGARSPTAWALAPSEEGDGLDLGADTLALSDVGAAMARTPPPPMSRTPEPSTRKTAPSNSLRPTLFLGLGGLAGTTLRRLRRRLLLSFGTLGAVPTFRFLLLDTDRAGLRPPRAARSREGFESDETLHLPLYRPEHYRERSKDLLRWLDRRWLYGIPRSLLTEGIRPLGRLALVTHREEVQGRLREALTGILSPAARAVTEAAVGRALDDESPRVFLVAAISGGTGGGMLIDVAGEVRRLLTELGHTDAALCAVLLHATSRYPAQSALARVNAYATLTELHQFSRPDGGEPPLPEMYLVHLGDSLEEGDAEASTEDVSEYLFRRAATPIGDVLEAHRPPVGAAAALRTFGLARLAFPRDALADAVANLLCRDVVMRWAGPAQRAKEEVRAEEAAALACSLGLSAEALGDFFHELVQASWGKDAESHLRDRLTARTQDMVRAAKGSDHPAAELLRQMDDAVGDGLGTPAAGDVFPPGAAHPAQGSRPALGQQAAAIGARRGEELVARLMAIVEDPDGRLLNAAETANALLNYLALVNDTARNLLKDYRAARQSIRDELVAAPPPRSAAATWLGGGRRGEPGPWGAKLLEYGRIRVKEFVVAQTVAVNGAVAQRVAQAAEQFSVARQKLLHLAAAFPPPEAGRSRDVGSRPATVTELLPTGCGNHADAARLLFQRFGARLAECLHGDVDAAVLQPKGGLWPVVNQDADCLVALEGELRRRALPAVAHALQDYDAAQILIQTAGDAAQALRTLQAQTEAALPPFLPPGAALRLVFAVPASAAGEQVRELLARLDAAGQVEAAESDGDVLCLTEAAYPSFAEIAARLAGEEVSNREIARRVTTRVDVTWQPLPGEHL